MTEKLNKLRVFTFMIGCMLFVLPVFLCGCGSESEAESHFKRGKVDYYAARYEAAVVAYKKAIALKPDYAEAYYNMAAAYSALGKYAEAISACEKVIGIDPTAKIAEQAREDIIMLRKQ
ncbi:MAG: tetratricopeptide repeat protein [bacterium]|nr:tetratricopeptide repeat protein [bacterium]